MSGFAYVCSGGEFKPMEEAEVRKLRALAYGECTLHNWESCKEHWMKPSEVQFLLERLNKKGSK